MGPLALLNHLLNFLAPALVVSLLMVLVARLSMRKRPQAHVCWAQAAINFVVCVLALLAGLMIFGRDGKMASYAALVLGCATSQWWMLRKA
jgi:L-asparagine transporter-like permease